MAILPVFQEFEMEQNIPSLEWQKQYLMTKGMSERKASMYAQSNVLHGISPVRLPTIDMEIKPRTAEEIEESNRRMMSAICRDACHYSYQITGICWAGD
jgi:hypothetical protein